MSRMKTFGLYALCVILFFIFSNIMIDIAIKATYNPIDTYLIKEENITIDIKEAKATYVNGYVGGTITNQTQENINQTYIQIDLFSKNNVYLGSKYIGIENWKQGETREFRIGFKFTNVKYAKVKRVEEVSPEVPENAFLSENLSFTILLSTIIFLCYFA